MSKQLVKLISNLNMLKFSHGGREGSAECRESLGWRTQVPIRVVVPREVQGRLACQRVTQSPSTWIT